jgi:hypothetical protein
MLPFEAQPLAELQARYPQAVNYLAPLIDPEEQALHEARPGLLRRHVFDHEDGLRLLVSVHDLPRLGPQLWLSASVVPGQALWNQLTEQLQYAEAIKHPKRRLKAARRVPTDFCAKTVQRFKLLSDHPAPVHFWFWSDGKGVPHFRTPADPKHLPALAPKEDDKHVGDSGNAAGLVVRAGGPYWPGADCPRAAAAQAEPERAAEPGVPPGAAAAREGGGDASGGPQGPRA